MACLTPQSTSQIISLSSKAKEYLGENTIVQDNHEKDDIIWIGLKISQPLLVGLQEGRDEVKE